MGADVDVLGADEVAPVDSAWWDGDINSIPIVSQDINLDDYLEMGDIAIYEMAETGWPYVDQGNVTISMGMEL